MSARDDAILHWEEMERVKYCSPDFWIGESKRGHDEAVWKESQRKHAAYLASRHQMSNYTRQCLRCGATQEQVDDPHDEYRFGPPCVPDLAQRQR